MKRILVLGMSHTVALSNAILETEKAYLEIVNLRTAPDIYHREDHILQLDARSWEKPDIVCLSIEGNHHNVISLTRIKENFRIGDEECGSVPADDKKGWFVPSDMMRMLLRQRLRQVKILESVIHAYFSDAVFIHISAPPPNLSFRADDNQGKLRERYVREFSQGFEAVPPLLRLTIYQLQCEIYMGFAAAFGAVFLKPPAAALSPQGFLDTAFRDDDPTHGNSAYGRLVIEQIKAIASESMTA